MDLVIARAPALRAAGVTSLTVDGVVILLAPAEPKVDATQSEPRSTGYVDPLDDAETFGGRGLPGFTRPVSAEDA